MRGVPEPVRRATTGCPAWTAAGRSIENTDVVLWYVFGIHHITRMEDWPIMPVDTVSFWLKPFGFFDRNPALDLPPHAVALRALAPGGTLVRAARSGVAGGRETFAVEVAAGCSSTQAELPRSSAAAWSRGAAVAWRRASARVARRSLACSVPLAGTRPNGGGRREPSADLRGGGARPAWKIVFASFAAHPEVETVFVAGLTGGSGSSRGQGAAGSRRRSRATWTPGGRCRRPCGRSS